MRYGHAVVNEAPETYPEFLDAMVNGPWTEPGHPRARAAAALRRLVHRAVAYDWADGDPRWAALADRLDAAVAEFGPDPPLGASRYDPAEIRNIDGPVIRPNSRGTHPLVGAANPVAPPLRLRIDGERVAADVIYDARHEGLSGYVQGGFIAAGFDLMLGQAMSLGGARGVTASLSVTYKNLTPIGIELRYEAWLHRIDGRKSWGAARLVRAGDETTTAQAEGLFIAPRNPLYS